MSLSVAEKNKFIKDYSHIIDLIRHNDFVDMKSLSQKSNYSWPTVKNSIDKLISNNVICYEKDNDIKKYFPQDNFGYFLGIAVGATETKIVLTDFNFNPVDLLAEDISYPFSNISKSLTVRIGENKSSEYLCFKTKRTFLEINDMCTSIIKTFLEAFEIDGKNDLLSIGISLPGIVNKETNVMSFCPNIPELVGVNVSKIIRSDIVDKLKAENIPFYICHDTIAATIYEKERLFDYENIEHKYRDNSNMAVLFLGSGFGAGYIIQNRLVFGASGAAGEIGHFDLAYNNLPLINTDENSLEAQDEKSYLFKGKKEKNVDLDSGICMCGKKGCLERLIRIKVFNAKNLDDFIEKTSKEELNAFASKHPYRYRVLKHFIGQVLNITVNMLNVELISLTGRILNEIPELKQEIESINLGNTLKVSSSDCHILTSSGRPDAVATGAAIMSYYNIYYDLSKKQTITW